MQILRTFFLSALLFTVTAREAGSQVPVKKYESEWKKVEQLVNKNLPKSALTEVKKIYALAKKDKQDAQIIRTLIYISDLQQETREDNEVLAIAEWEKELAGAKEPAASVIKSILAGKYLQYFNRQRYRIYDRTATEKFSKQDPATWDASDFHKRISALYLQSLANIKTLQQTRLDQFEPVLFKGNMRHLRPTLYDLLAHEALDYFENDEREIQRPAYAFEMDQAGAFDPAADFIHLKFPTRDTLSLHQKALEVYQDLLAFHLRDAKPDALIDADLRRIHFVKNNSVHPEKDSLYFNAINHIAQQYQDLPAATQAWYLLAAYHEEKAAAYTPYGDSTHRYSRVKAREILERILLQKDSSEGRVNAHNLLLQVNAMSLQFELEKVNLPAQPFRASVQYRNFSKLYLRLVKADEKLKDNLQDPYDEKYWPTLLAAEALRNWEEELPATGDLQEHRTEIKIDGLPAGDYVLLASAEPGFKKDKGIIGARLFHVSGISFINQREDYFILDRESGHPLANASVQVWQRVYNYNTSKYTRQKLNLYHTDKNGFVRVQVSRDEKNPRANRDLLFDIRHGNDRLFMDDYVYDTYYYGPQNKKAEPLTRVFLFTDRSLYRPAQAVYFKAIVVETSGKERTGAVRPDYTTKVYLRDANSQVIDSMELKTNEFGSFHGVFQLPQGSLNGSFSVFTKKDNSYAGFRVEDYKRPKFYVEYEPIKGTYELNDSISITGIAKAYAGNKVDMARVKYRVVRQPRFLYPWLYWRWWLPPSPPLEIAHGETSTDAEGKFRISFKAIPDLSIDKKLDPVFDYKVYTDITDIAGETRSGEKMLTVGYKSLVLKTTIADRFPTDSLYQLAVRTENMNGEFEPSKVTVTLTRQKEETRLIRSRYWERPDQFVYSREDYIRLFPHDEYDNETDPRSWELDRQVWQQTDSTSAQGFLKLQGPIPAPGFYVLEIKTRDRNNREVKEIRYLELYDEKETQLVRPQYLWTKPAGPAEPGETATVGLGTSAEDIFVIQGLDRNTNRDEKDSLLYTFTTLHREKKEFRYQIDEADRGGFGVNWAFVKHNRVHQYGQTVSVPWTNKDLRVEYITYRDKVLPGSEEKWKVKITGNKKEQVAAEMLAGMYDASLDQFYPHSWNKPNVWPSYYGRILWNGSTNFRKLESRSDNYYPGGFQPLHKIYDRLMTSMYMDRYGVQTVLQGRVSGLEVMADAAPMIKRGKEDDMAPFRGNKFEAAKLSDSVAEPPGEGMDAEQQAAQSPEVQIRKNFNETAFFLPELRTDANGDIEFSFTMPEALTRWKFMALTHTKDASFGLSTTEILTQKQLMVQPNAPRFLREGDRIEFSTRIVNLTDRELTGQVELQLVDGTTHESVDGWFKNMLPNQYFTVAAGQSTAALFPLEVPYLFNNTLVWRVIARVPGAETTLSDGEENMLPVLTNRMLVTESVPLHIRGTGTDTFRFDKLLQSGQSESLRHQSITVEYSSNPAWYAVQALPYLMEYPYDCAEQVWNRYYANSLASMIANSSPRIRQVFEKWKISDTAALLSNLQKNEELKSVLLEETPWVLAAKSEAEQKKNIALLFDLVRMKQELNSSADKLIQMQSPNGGFVWFKGGPDDRYITQYIATGMGHLLKLRALADDGQTAKLYQVLNKAIPYLDNKIREDYDALKKTKADLGKHVPDYTNIQYLYMRSFFPEMKMDAAVKTAYNYYRKRAQATWTRQNKYMQGMTALALHRTGDAATPTAILRSLKETSISHEELGMYWKDAARSWWWYDAPIERQALMVEAFQEIAKDDLTANDLRTWLLKNKQTNNWNTTKATAEAVYALLLQGNDWLDDQPIVSIKLGNTAVQATDPEEGTGYFKTVVESRDVTPSMGNITLTVTPADAKSPGDDKGQPSWGAVYWQYFEDMDKITRAATPLKLEKKLFVEKNTDRGPVLTPIEDGDAVKVGDKIKVRIELRVDREMEYVHMKDTRASAMEPVNVLSSYKWQGGLGYYETTRDASTHFFFSSLRRGTYVFEYPLFITHTGNFSTGITSIQCMYAPEFNAHSEGGRINVE